MSGEEYVKRYIEWAKEIYKNRDWSEVSKKMAKINNKIIEKYYGL